jgi:hypothetical protein
MVPDPATLALLEAWMDSNMKEGSTLHTLLLKKLRDALLYVVCRTVLPASAASLEWSVNCSSCPSVALGPMPAGLVGFGLEPLAPEIQYLGDRIAKLVAFHSHVYRHLYASTGFMVGAEDDN